MIIENPPSLKTNLYVVPPGAVPRIRLLNQGGQETFAPSRAQRLLSWIESYFRQTSAERMAVTSLAFWG